MGGFSKGKGALAANELQRALQENELTLQYQRERISHDGLIRAFEEAGRGTTFAQAYAQVAGESLPDFERVFPARLAIENASPKVSREPGSDGVVRWTASGFGARALVEITIKGSDYEISYAGVTDRYGMYSAVFGQTAPPGEYSMRVVGPGGAATGAFDVTAVGEVSGT